MRGSRGVADVWFVMTSLFAMAAFDVSGQDSRQVAPHPSPPVLWHVEGEGRGRPATNGTSVYFLGKQHEVVAVDTQAGRVRWRTATGEPGEGTNGSAVILFEDLVVAGDYNVIALDALTGRLRWKFVPDEGYAPGLYLGDASDQSVFAGSPAGRVYAVDRMGREQWSRIVKDDGKTTVYAPTTDGDVVAARYTTFVSPNSGGVVLIDADAGHELWRTEFPQVSTGGQSTHSAGGPVLYQDLVIASSGTGEIYALERSTGAIRWHLRSIASSADTTAPDFRPLARSGDVLLAGSLSGVVVAYDLRTQQERWRSGGLQDGSVNFNLTADEVAVYVPHLSGRLVALNVEDGSLRWRVQDSRPGFEWPAASFGGLLYAAASRGGFFAFRR